MYIVNPKVFVTRPLRQLDLKENPFGTRSRKSNDRAFSPCGYEFLRAPSLSCRLGFPHTELGPSATSSKRYYRPKHYSFPLQVPASTFIKALVSRSLLNPSVLDLAYRSCRSLLVTEPSVLLTVLGRSRSCFLFFCLSPM